MGGRRLCPSQEKYSVRLPVDSEGMRCDHYGRPAPRTRKDSILIISLSESAWVICAPQEQSWALRQIWKVTLGYVIHKLLIERHLEWCNAKTSSSLCATRGSKGGEESECEREEKETEEDSKGLITAYHREDNVHRSNSPVGSPPCQRMIAEIKGQLAPRPSPCRRLAAPGKTVLQCLPRWLRRGIVHLFAKKNRVPFQAFKKAKMARTALQRWPVIHNNKDVISRRVEGTLLCTSVGLAARFLIFIHILIYFHEKPSLFFFSSAEKCRRWKCDTL